MPSRIIPGEGGKRTLASPLIIKLYKVIHSESVRSFLRRAVLRLEGDWLYSRTIRAIFQTFHGVEFGLYSTIPSFPGALSPGTIVGRYTTIYSTVRAFSANHPTNTKSTHAFFYNPGLGKVASDLITRGKLTIGNDVWIGHNAIILPSVESIGDGAVVGAGAVVATSVPPYAVVTGYPARIVRFRFSQKTIGELVQSKWWTKGIDELVNEIDGFRRPLEGEGPVR